MSVSVILSCFARVQAVSVKSMQWYGFTSVWATIELCVSFGYMSDQVIRCIYMKHLYQSDLRNKSASWSRCCILVVRSLMPPQVLCIVIVIWLCWNILMSMTNKTTCELLQCLLQMMTSLRGAIQQAVGVFLLGSLIESSRFGFAINEVLSEVLLQCKSYFRTRVWKELNTTI